MGPRDALDRALKLFVSSGSVQDRARNLHVNSELYWRAAQGFRKFLLRSSPPALLAHLQVPTRLALHSKSCLCSAFQVVRSRV